MRISDWSSDVCSSDLRLAGADPGALLVAEVDLELHAARGGHFLQPLDHQTREEDHRAAHEHRVGDLLVAHALDDRLRSEEHTSELQSLMRISYAVFCLKTKNTINQCKSNLQHTHTKIIK